jgi:hypothetical protein
MMWQQKKSRVKRGERCKFRNEKKIKKRGKRKETRKL